MQPLEVVVKSSPRRYDGSGRRARAQLTRASIVGAARELFLTDGYAPTTVAAVSSQAGVSVETVYKIFGGKAGLARAVCEQALAGSGPVHAEQRSDELQRTETDPRAIVRGWGALAAEVAPRVIPILLLLREAASHDPSIADLVTELDNARLARMTRNAAVLSKSGLMRGGLTKRHAGEILWTYSSPELYELLVSKRGWSIHRYAQFITEAMVTALLVDSQSTDANQHRT
jgi:AcrR family transcriptional regulator